MRIGFDARMIYNSGIGTFVYNFLEIATKYSDFEFVLFGDPAVLHRYPCTIEPFTKKIYSIGEQIFWHNAYKKHKLDILHLPHYNFPFFYGKKMIIHIHDLIHLLFPQFLPNRLAYYYAKFFLNQASVKADLIIVNSMNTKNDVIKELNANPAKIRVIPYAASEQYRLLTDSERKDKSYIYEKYNLPEKYILYVGNLRPLKNVPALLAAFRKFYKNTGSDYHLVLIGRNFMPEWYIKANMEDNIHFVGEVDKDDLPAIYNFAAIFVFPSLYEGFGLPVLEAMSCGTPVICSRRGSLEEVAGDAACFVDESSALSITQAIEKLIYNPQERHRLREKGLLRAKDFSWDKTANEILTCYRQIDIKSKQE